MRALGRTNVYNAIPYMDAEDLNYAVMIVAWAVITVVAALAIFFIDPPSNGGAELLAKFHEQVLPAWPELSID